MTSGAAAARVVLRPIANPLPLGFLALAGGTLLVSGLQLGWLAPAQGDDVALCVLAFVFPLQLVASVFGFLGRDVVAGTGMGVLAGTWLAIALVTLSAPAPGATSDALGLTRGSRIESTTGLTNSPARPTKNTALKPIVVAANRSA